MHMVGHHDPFVQHVALAYEVPYRTADQLSYFRASQMTGPVSPVEIPLHLTPKFAVDQFLRIVGRPTFATGALETTKAFGLLCFKLKQHLRGQRIGQSERDKVCRSLTFHMREITTRVDARSKGS